MTKHGASGHFEPTDSAQRGEPGFNHSDYRNMFGEAAARDRYTGLGQDPKGRAETRHMLRWLAQRMLRDKVGAADENARIPAGYTYLAQLVAHDSVHSLAPLPDIAGRSLTRRNGRTARLLLDTLYGGGPDAEPHAYAITGKSWDGRSRLRLGTIREVQSSRSPKLGTTRDLARTGCPYSDDRNAFPIPNKQQSGAPDVLITDARNDDNVIISQLSVLFMLLHNQLCATVEADDGKPLDARRFGDVRRVVTLVYRRILFEDLLPRLLHPAVLRAYKKKKALADFADDGADWRMPIEFSHGAFRFGHAMVRGSYAINDDLPTQGLIQIVRRNSAMRPKNMPLTHDWLVDWSFLFETGKGRELPSRKLAPLFNEEFVKGYLFPVTARDDSTHKPGDWDGLVYRDLVRGADAGLRSVRSLLDRLDPELRDLSPLVRNGKLNRRKIASWLRRRTDGDRRAATYIRNIAGDPPLMFFLLLEAAETEIATGRTADRREQGECLGPVGSALLAEFFFREKLRTQDLIEGDAALTALANSLFAARGVPASMPALIAEIAATQEWTGPDYQFS